MPTVSADKERLFRALGKPDMSIDEFDQLCFDFGVELDEVTSQREMLLKEKQTTSAADAAMASDRTILKIDVSANRYDLLCEEGLARSMRIYLGKEKPPPFKVTPPANAVQSIRVKAEVCRAFFPPPMSHLTLLPSVTPSLRTMNPSLLIP